MKLKRLSAISYDPVKRWLDLAFGFILFLMSLPLQAAIALLVFVALGRPVLFRQARPGRHAKVFCLIKFRTMKNLDVSSGLVSDADRMTRVGKFLRSTSLDELPTLMNVIRGEMSLVGPRPLLVEYLERYNYEESQRHDVRPGITGLAQVNGRNDQSWQERLALDVHYVRNRTLLLDFRILWKTIMTVMKREGIASPGHMTMHEFRGSAVHEG